MKKLINTIVKPMLLLLLLWPLGRTQVCAQGKLQVATKKIEKTVSASSVRTLFISAEKADIEIVTWENPNITIVMELSSRHPDRSVAAQDLSKLQYIADRNGKDYFLRNYIVLKNGESKPVSNLKARYTIHLPASCGVDLKNSFGTISLTGLTNELRLNADFCTTSLRAVSGTGTVQTTFGELAAKELAGTFTFSSDHTNVRLQQIAGAVRIDADYGVVEIYPTVGLTSLAIRSKKAEVLLLNKNWQQFDYNINGAYATMKLPNGFKWKRNTSDFKEAFFSRNQLATVNINAEFGKLTIK